MNKQIYPGEKNIFIRESSCCATMWFNLLVFKHKEHEDAQRF